MRILNVARGPLIVDEDLEAALDSGKVGGAALDVFRSEPVTEHPLFGCPNVIVTPHLGASTAEATDRAGYQAAEQVVAALTGGAVTTAVNVPAVAAEDLEVLGPFLPLCRQLGRLAVGAGRRASVDASRSSSSAGSPSATRGRWASRCCSASCSGHTEEDVNEVNAPAIAARARASRSPRPTAPHARDFTDLVRVTVIGGDAPRARRRHDARPPQPAAPARGVGPALQPPARGRTSRSSATATCPGMIGRVGTALGEHGINILSAAVGYEPADEDDGEAVMVVTTDRAVPAEVVAEIVGSDGFVDGRAVSLAG